MKEITNKRKKMLILDLNSFDEKGIRKSVHIAPEESVVIEDSELRSRQVDKALRSGDLEVKSKKKSKKEEKKEKKVSEEKEDALEEAKVEDKSKTKKEKKKYKTSDKEDK